MRRVPEDHEAILRFRGRPRFIKACEECLCDWRLSMTARVVWTYLSKYDYDGDHAVFPSQAVQARALHISLRTVNRAIADLKSAGWVTTEWEEIAPGRKVLVYTLCWDNEVPANPNN